MTKDETTLREFFATVAASLDVVMITLSKDESPYKIFRSLNSTGVDLNESDLVRNHIFMAVPINQQDLFDDTRWQPFESRFLVGSEVDEQTLSAFFRDALMRSGTYVAKEGTYDAFEGAYPIASLNAAAVADEFTVQAEHYDWIRGRIPHAEQRVNRALDAIRRLNASTSYPLLLALFDLQRSGKVTFDEVSTACECIAGFILRRHVCGMSSREYGRWFSAACRGHDGKPLAVSSLKTVLQDRGWPENDAFAMSFKRFQLYQSQYGTYILKAIELAIQNPSEPVVLDGPAPQRTRTHR